MGMVDVPVGRNLDGRTMADAEVYCLEIFEGERVVACLGAGFPRTFLHTLTGQEADLHYEASMEAVENYVQMLESLEMEGPSALRTVDKRQGGKTESNLLDLEPRMSTMADSKQTEILADWCRIVKKELHCVARKTTYLCMSHEARVAQMKEMVFRDRKDCRTEQEAQWEDAVVGSVGDMAELTMLILLNWVVAVAVVVESGEKAFLAWSWADSDTGLDVWQRCRRLSQFSCLSLRIGPLRMLV